MWRSNFLLTLRMFRKDILLSVIIVSSLAISYASFHMLWLYTTTELAADRHHPHADRVYRVYYNWRYTDDGKNYKDGDWGAHLFTTGPWFKSKYPEVEAFTRIVHQSGFGREMVGHTSNIHFSYETPAHTKVAFKEEQVVYADENLFTFFDIPLVRGDKRTVLKDAAAVVLSERAAHKYFGREEAVGRILVLNDERTLTVTGVFKDLPSNTHLQFDIVLSDARFANTFTAHDFSGEAHTYLRVAEGTDEAAFYAKVNATNPAFWAPMKFVWETGTNRLQRLADTPFVGNIALDNFRVKSKAILRILQVVAVFILVMGWINYINLTFSRVMKRMKELATRRTFGAAGRDFLLQFFSETLLLNLIAVALAVLLGLGSSGLIERFTNVPLPKLSDLSLPGLYAAVLLAGCLATALYPTLVARGFNVRALQAYGAKSSRPGRWFITGISVFQYSISVILIVWVYAMHHQLRFLLDADTGMDKEHVVVIDGPQVRGANYVTQVATWQHALEQIDGVRGVTSSMTLPGDAAHRMVLFSRPGKSFNAGLYTNGGVDENFLSFFNIPLVAGRNFKKDMPSERGVVMISETGAKRLGFASADDAIGQRLVLADWDAATEDTDTREVIGVFKDYALAPYIRSGVEKGDESSGGLCLSYRNFSFASFSPERIAMRVTGRDVPAVMNEAEKRFADVFNEAFFHWYFLDEHYNRGYAYHQNFKHQIMLFAGLAIFIACLGLIGTTSFLALEKVKELGVRKVLGAGWASLGYILVRTAARQIVVSLVAGIPMAIYFIGESLQQYTLRADLHAWLFVPPVLVLMAVLLLTVVPILYRAIRVNPVEALKNTN